MIKIGMIGYNEGNGHPYSFSAIINGYDQYHMVKSPYKVIADYLAIRTTEEFGIGDLKVTHIWTPFPEISESIAQCCFIDNIVSSYQEMLGQVDAVIIARDDAENRFEIGKYFLDNNVPAFIDKPLCINEQELSYFKPHLESGLLMSASGLRYFPEIIKLSEQINKEDIIFYHAVSPGEWLKYGLHLIESVAPICGHVIDSLEQVQQTNEERTIKLNYSQGFYGITHVHTNIHGGIRVQLFYKNRAPSTLVFNDNFTCFKTLLNSFYQQLETKINAIPVEETLKLVTVNFKALKAPCTI